MWKRAQELDPMLTPSVTEPETPGVQLNCSALF